VTNAHDKNEVKSTNVNVKLNSYKVKETANKSVPEHKTVAHSKALRGPGSTVR